MTMDIQPAGTRSGGTLLRVICGGWTLLLSLVCVVSSFRQAIGMTGTDALTIWGFFVWGVGLSIGGVWLIRGRSKGKAIVIVLDRKRVAFVAVMAVVIVGLLVYIMNLQPVEGDPIGRELILQTMFAVLFASLPFMLFDREDHREQNAPIQVTAAGRRRARWILLLMVACGALLIALGIAADAQLDPWWTSLLRQVGYGLLGSAAVLAFQLRKKRSTKAGPEPESGTDAGSPASR